jgi:trehalose synthase
LRRERRAAPAGGPLMQRLPKPLDAYREVVGDSAIDELHQLAAALRGKKVQHINATRSGGGVAEILNRLCPLMCELGLQASWDVLEGEPAFFQVTKAFHNAIQGEPIEIGQRDFEIFLECNRRNGRRIDLYGDFVFVHDPQPAALVEKRAPAATGQRCVWRCHIDASHPHPGLWAFLERYLRRYDASMFSAPLFAHGLAIPMFLITPSIDPLSDKNRPLDEEFVRGVLAKYGVDPERPILTQVSRFDRFKDPLGLVRMYRMVKETHDCQMILVGGGATDDPEGAQVLAEVREAAGEDRDLFVLELPSDSHLEINAIQRGSTIIYQKSIKEGFGLTVSEGMWKGRPVIGGATGGIPLQIVDGVTGYLVSSVEGAAFRTRYLLNHPEVAQEMGRKGVENVRQNHLLTRNLRDYLMIMHAVSRGGKGLISL